MRTRPQLLRPPPQEDGFDEDDARLASPFHIRTTSRLFTVSSVSTASGGTLAYTFSVGESEERVGSKLSSRSSAAAGEEGGESRGKKKAKKTKKTKKKKKKTSRRTVHPQIRGGDGLGGGLV